jgi:hypothetical protein
LRAAKLGASQSGGFDMMRALCLLSLLLLNLLAAAPAHAASPYRDVEACFVLDTTGSMSGLIEAAKQKIWYIAGRIAAAPSKPAVRLCLIAFRDRGDEYVTRRFDLTADIDAIYAELSQLRADGGGDTPEAVNQALHEAVELSAWSQRDDVLRLIFLVGDAPPKVYADEPQYPQIAARAKQRGILINPVLCGGDGDALRSFSDIGRLGGGELARLVDAGRVERIETPMDSDLAVLNHRLGRLILPYGDEEARETVLAKQVRAEKMNDAGVSDRLAFNRSTARIVQGRGDLLQDLDAGAVRLADLQPEQLPAAVRSMSEAELLAYLEDVRQERDGLQEVIGRMVELRNEYIEARRAGDSQGFDGVVARIIEGQLAAPRAGRN